MEKRIDDTGFGGLKILQNPDMFCYGVDAVILAEAALAEAAKAERIADLGCGNGIIPLILAKCTEGTKLLGVDILEENCLLAEESARLNGLDHRIDFLNENVQNLKSRQGGVYDLVTSNPPYIKASRGIVSEDEKKAVARHEVRGTLRDFMEGAEHLHDPKAGKIGGYDGDRKSHWP